MQTKTRNRCRFDNSQNSSAHRKLVLLLCMRVSQLCLQISVDRTSKLRRFTTYRWGRISAPTHFCLAERTRQNIQDGPHETDSPQVDRWQGAPEAGALAVDDPCPLHPQLLCPAVPAGTCMSANRLSGAFVLFWTAHSPRAGIEQVLTVTVLSLTLDGLAARSWPPRPPARARPPQVSYKAAESSFVLGGVCGCGALCVLCCAQQQPGSASPHCFACTCGRSCTSSHADAAKRWSPELSTHLPQVA